MPPYSQIAAFILCTILCTKANMKAILSLCNLFGCLWTCPRVVLLVSLGCLWAVSTRALSHPLLVDVLISAVELLCAGRASLTNPRHLLICFILREMGSNCGEREVPFDPLLVIAGNLLGNFVQLFIFVDCNMATAIPTDILPQQFVPRFTCYIWCRDNYKLAS